MENWVEKYRPKNLNEIYSQDKLIELLNNPLFYNNLPHLIFSGPSGCGKTSTILSFANKIFNNNKEKIIEYNASNDRGINIIRENIKNYAKQSNKDKNTTSWKIIILDEADTITSDSQFALRRTMEQYSKSTRFCIICNNISKIIEPLISRCSHFIFNKITDDDIKKYLKYVCENEKINYDYILDKIILNSNGDMRMALNLLELFHNSKNKNLDSIINIIPTNNFNNLIKYINDKDYYEINKTINEIFYDSYSITNQLMLFHKYILDLDISDKKKSLLFLKLSEINQNLKKGHNEYLQYFNFFYYFIYLDINFLPFLKIEN